MFCYSQPTAKHMIASRLICNSDSSISTKCVHGSGRTLQTLVSCGSQQANLPSFTTSYSLTEPSEFIVKNLPTSGSVLVTLVGKFFGCNDASVNIVFVPTYSSSSSWIASSNVRVKVPSGISHSGKAVQRIAGRICHQILFLSIVHQFHLLRIVSLQPAVLFWFPCLGCLLRCNPFHRGHSCEVLPLLPHFGPAILQCWPNYLAALIWLLQLDFWLVVNMDP
jgi:hypothetical protein